MANRPVEVYDISSSPHDTAPVYYRSSPWKVVWDDLFLVLRQSPKIPLILYPVPLPGVDAAGNAILAQGAALLITGLWSAAAVMSLVWGIPSPLVVVLSLTAITVSFALLQGDRRRHSAGPPPAPEFENEAWIFVNGVATSPSGLQRILDHFQLLFGRRVTGIHNRTNGIWFDLIECLLQRDFFWPTRDVQDGYMDICQALRNESKTRIVLLAHSQGTIILSIWVDQLLADFPRETLARIEIYTFATAANHFSGPITDAYQTFARIEHFVNTLDFVSCIGLIKYAPKITDAIGEDAEGIPQCTGRFAGRIFKRLGATGHLLLTHYLNPGASFLDDPTVRQHSRLVQYLDGGVPAD